MLVIKTGAKEPALALAGFPKKAGSYDKLLLLTL